MEKISTSQGHLLVITAIFAIVYRSFGSKEIPGLPPSTRFKVGFPSPTSMKSSSKRTARQSKVALNVLLGKSPGAALKRFGQKAYTIEAQKEDCQAVFDRKFGKRGWKVHQYYVRNFSARKSKTWPRKLNTIIAETKERKAVLATSTVCRMLRNIQDLIAI